MKLDTRIRKLEARKAVGRRCSRCGQHVCENTARIFDNLCAIIEAEGGEPEPVCSRCGMPRERPEQPTTFDELKARLAEVAREHFVPGDSIHE